MDMFRDCHEISIYNQYSKKLVGYAGLKPYTPISNNFCSEFIFGGHTWSFAENALLYMKAICFQDFNVADYILKSKSPIEASTYAKCIRGVDNELWDVYERNQLYEILFAKFDQNDKLKVWLLCTGNAILAEIATENKYGRIISRDTKMGINIGENHPDISEPNLWYLYGENLIGNTLMKIRNIII